MNTKITVALVMLFTLNTLQAHAGSLPVCSETVEAPCVLSTEDAKKEIIDMIFANKEGFDQISKVAKDGFQVGLFTDGNDDSKLFRVTMVSDVQIPRNTPGGPDMKSQVKYEILLDDCRGTDACEGTYVWTVIENTDGDGYTYENKFTNTITKVATAIGLPVTP